MFEYYTVADSEQIRFYQLPKELVKNKQFKVLSDSAKILYALLRDRVSLSVKNNWVDELGRVYIIFTLAEIMEDLGCADQKATKSMKELQKIGLVESIRRGLGKPNIIYVKNFARGNGTEKSFETPINSRTRENHESESVKITSQNSLKSRTRIRENHEQSILNLNKTNLNDNESESTSESKSKSKSGSKSGSMSDQTIEISTDNPDETMTVDNENVIAENILDLEKEKEEELLQATFDLQSPSTFVTKNKSSIDDYITYKRLIQDNIDYNHYLYNRHMDIDLVDELINCMLDVICTQGVTVKINGELKSREMIKSQYLKISSTDIDHVLDRYKEQRHKITHLHAYLKTMLYTVKQETGHYYTNAVRKDGIVR